MELRYEEKQLLHLNDIDNCLRHCKIIKYVDDTVIYTSVKCSEPIQKKLNEDITEVNRWLNNNDLFLNLKKGKTECILFGTLSRIKKAPSLNISINSIEVIQTMSYKFLGVHLDSALNLNENFGLKYKKLRSGLRLLSKLRSNLIFKAAKKLYSSVAVPVFTYCGLLQLNLCRTSSAKKLEQIHQRAITIITRNKTGRSLASNYHYDQTSRMQTSTRIHKKDSSLLQCPTTMN